MALMLFDTITLLCSLPKGIEQPIWVVYAVC